MNDRLVAHIMKENPKATKSRSERPRKTANSGEIHMTDQKRRDARISVLNGRKVQDTVHRIEIVIIHSIPKIESKSQKTQNIIDIAHEP